MAIFVVTYTYTPDMGRAGRLRPQRHEFFATLERQGHLLASGQLTGGNLADGLLVLQAPDASTAATLLDADPFVTEGLVDQRVIAPWNPTTGAWIGN